MNKVRPANPRNIWLSGMLMIDTRHQVKRLPDADEPVEYRMERRASLLERINKPKGNKFPSRSTTILS